MKKNCKNCRMFLAFDGECPDFRPDSMIIEEYNGVIFQYCELYEEEPGIIRADL